MQRVRGVPGQLLARHDLPAVVFSGALFCVMVAVQPSVLSSSGLDLTFLGIVPLAFATVAQLIVMVGGDIDLSIGSAVGLVNAIASTELVSHLWVGIGELALFLVGYVLMGTLIEVRKLPSIIVTFAFGFVWLGFALVVLPVPGGDVPGWLTSSFSASIPGIPEPLLVLGLLAAASWVLMYSTRFGKLVRALGNKRLSAQQFSRSPLQVRMQMYLIAGIAIVLGGLALTAQSGSGDPNSGQSYVLMSIGAVIIGGGEFAGGNAWPVGAVFGAIALGLVSSIDSFLQISSDLVIGLQGVLLIAALAVRRLVAVWRRPPTRPGGPPASGADLRGDGAPMGGALERSSLVPGNFAGPAARGAEISN